MGMMGIAHILARTLKIAEKPELWNNEVELIRHLVSAGLYKDAGYKDKMFAVRVMVDFLKQLKELWRVQDLK